MNQKFTLVVVGNSFLLLSFLHYDYWRVVLQLRVLALHTVFLLSWSVLISDFQVNYLPLFETVGGWDAWVCKSPSPGSLCSADQSSTTWSALTLLGCCGCMLHPSLASWCLSTNIEHSSSSSASLPPLLLGFMSHIGCEAKSKSYSQYIVKSGLRPFLSMVIISISFRINWRSLREITRSQPG